MTAADCVDSPAHMSGGPDAVGIPVPSRRAPRRPPLLVLLMAGLLEARRRRLLRDLQGRAEWAMQARTAATLQQWTESIASGAPMQPYRRDAEQGRAGDGSEADALRPA